MNERSFIKKVGQAVVLGSALVGGVSEAHASSTPKHQEAVEHAAETKEEKKLDRADQKLIEEAEKRTSISADPKAVEMIQSWGGDITGWVVVENPTTHVREAKYQFALTGQYVQNPWTTDEHAVSLNIMRDIHNQSHEVVVVCHNDDGTNDIVRVYDGVVEQDGADPEFVAPANVHPVLR